MKVKKITTVTISIDKKEVEEILKKHVRENYPQLINGTTRLDIGANVDPYDKHEFYGYSVSFSSEENS